MARDTDHLLASIDALVGAVDQDAVVRHVEFGTCDGTDSYIALCGSTREALRHLHLLVDDDGAPRDEDLFGLKHLDGCRCTLCLWPEFPRDEGEVWMSAAPAVSGAPLEHLVVAASVDGCSMLRTAER